MHYNRMGISNLLTLLNVLLQVNKAVIEELLLVLVDLSKRVDLLNTVGSKLDLGGEEIDSLVLVQRAVYEGGLNDTLGSLSSLQEALSEAGTGHGHGEGSGSGTILGLDDLITTELDALDELITDGSADVGVVGLGEKGNDGDTGVATDNGDVLVGWVGRLDLRDESGSADNIKGGDTEQALGVVDTVLLEDLGNNWDSGVNLNIFILVNCI
jgi:hypothetical protein